MANPGKNRETQASSFRCPRELNSHNLSRNIGSSGAHPAASTAACESDPHHVSSSGGAHPAENTAICNGPRVLHSQFAPAHVDRESRSPWSQRDWARGDPAAGRMVHRWAGRSFYKVGDKVQLSKEGEVCELGYKWGKFGKHGWRWDALKPRWLVGNGGVGTIIGVSTDGVVRVQGVNGFENWYADYDVELCDCERDRYGRNVAVVALETFTTDNMDEVVVIWKNTMGFLLRFSNDSQRDAIVRFGGLAEDQRVGRQLFPMLDDFRRDKWERSRFLPKDKTE